MPSWARNAFYPPNNNKIFVAVSQNTPLFRYNGHEQKEGSSAPAQTNLKEILIIHVSGLAMLFRYRGMNEKRAQNLTQEKNFKKMQKLLSRFAPLIRYRE